MSIFDERNLSMMMDLYEMTMSNGYHKEACGHDRATFDVFFRRVPDDGGYAKFAGLEQFVDFEDQDVLFLYSTSLLNSSMLLK